MAAPVWFRSRAYPHFDVPVGHSFAARITAADVAANAWSPLIHYLKEDRRYKPQLRKTIKKPRPIMYASHRDACILSKYSAELSGKLDAWYQEQGLSDSVIAYRTLGKANYHFAKAVDDYVKCRSPVAALCFDVTGFFDNIDHTQLKDRLRRMLGCVELPKDWYRVYRSITQYRYVNLDDLKAHPVFGSRLAAKRSVPIATMQELKVSTVVIHKNPNTFGIPQGTPISAAFSNLFMIDFDREVSRECSQRGALYQRYSDDILVACEPTDMPYFLDFIERTLKANGLDLQKAKTDCKILAGKGSLTYQYLGYQLGHGDAQIRPGSLSRQWRSIRRAIRRTEKAGDKAIADGRASTIFTRKLHTRINDAKARNFLAYATRSADALGSTTIKKQAKRLRRFVNREMARLKDKGRPE